MKKSELFQGCPYCGHTIRNSRRVAGNIRCCVKCRTAFQAPPDIEKNVIRRMVDKSHVFSGKEFLTNKTG